MGLSSRPITLNLLFLTSDKETLDCPWDDPVSRLRGASEVTRRDAAECVLRKNGDVTGRADGPNKMLQISGVLT